MRRERGRQSGWQIAKSGSEWGEEVTEGDRENGKGEQEVKGKEIERVANNVKQIAGQHYRERRA